MTEVDEETLFNRASFAKLRKTEEGFQEFQLAPKFRFLIGSIYEPMKSLKTIKSFNFPLFQFNLELKLIIRI